MQQEQLLYECAEDAIRAAMQLARVAPKAVATEIWPSLKPETAYARLMACLNPDKPEKLTMGEIVLICRITGRADVLFWLADELGYARPDPMPDEDQEAELMAQFNDSVRVLQLLSQRFEENRKAPVIKSAFPRRTA